jgi:hypothetical protein
MPYSEVLMYRFDYHRLPPEINHGVGAALFLGLFIFVLTRPVNLPPASFMAWGLLAVAVGLIGLSIWFGVQLAMERYMGVGKEK